MIPYEYVDETYIAKNEMHRAAMQLSRRHHPAFIRFDTIPACDGRTDGQKCYS